MLVGAVGGKGLASWISGALFGYRNPQILMMWSLTMPKVAATLATAFIGFQAGLLNQMVLNLVLAVMVVTATLGPILTERSVTRLNETTGDQLPASFGEEAFSGDGDSEVVQRPLRIVVPWPTPAPRRAVEDGGSAGKGPPAVRDCCCHWRWSTPALRRWGWPQPRRGGGAVEAG